MPPAAPRTATLLAERLATRATWRVVAYMIMFVSIARPDDLVRCFAAADGRLGTPRVPFPWSARSRRAVFLGLAQVVRTAFPLTRGCVLPSPRARDRRWSSRGLCAASSLPIPAVGEGASLAFVLAYLAPWPLLSGYGRENVPSRYRQSCKSKRRHRAPGFVGATHTRARPLGISTRTAPPREKT